MSFLQKEATAARLSGMTRTLGWGSLMLEPPNISYTQLTSVLQREYALQVKQIDFLPLGADVDTAVYRVITEDHSSYFVKLRRSAFNESSVIYPKYLHDQGVQHIIPVLPGDNGGLWTNVQEYKLVLYPFVEGSDAYQVALSKKHWLVFGATLKRIHEVTPPDSLLRRLPQEAYSDHWRATVKALLERRGAGLDPVAVDMVGFLESKRDDIGRLIERTEDLAAVLKAQELEPTVCHADLHAGNLLVGKDGGLYLVDWDTLLLAPKERDLMFIGAGLIGSHWQPDEERKPFFKGYGDTEVSDSALAYFRYERIIQDIAAFGEQLLSGEGGDKDRKQSLRYLKANFLPGGTIGLALRAEQSSS
jgi:spectinomycin phosphotransferase